MTLKHVTTRNMSCMECAALLEEENDYLFIEDGPCADCIGPCWPNFIPVIPVPEFSL